MTMIDSSVYGDILWVLSENQFPDVHPDRGPFACIHILRIRPCRGPDVLVVHRLLHTPQGHAGLECERPERVPEFVGSDLEPSLRSAHLHDNIDPVDGETRRTEGAAQR